MINIYSVMATISYAFNITTGIMLIFMCIKATKFHGKKHIRDKKLKSQHYKEEIKLKYFLRILIVLIMFIASSFGCIISTLLNPHVLSIHLCVL